MHMLFFPDPVFGWIYVGVLVTVLAIASYTDLRRMIVPKWLTLTALPLGILFNVLRGVWLGGLGETTWVLGQPTAGNGALDGLVFALSGFAVGFSLFFLMWILGTCGGGDVKLFAALGAWVGPLLVLFVLFGTIVVISVFTFGRLLTSFPASGFRSVFRAGARKPAHVQVDPANRRPQKRLLTYSLPVAVVTAVVLLWSFRVDLRLALPKEANGGANHGSVR